MTDECIVCGKVCGSLKGRAKSWPCAGRLAHDSRTGKSQKARDSLRAKYDNPDKGESRRAIEKDLIALPAGAKVLDLYGGGLSAEWITSLRPDVTLIVAEHDKDLWPALRADATRLGFTPVAGDFLRAAPYGPFDLIWLDLCGDILTAYEAVLRVVPLMARKPAHSLHYGYYSTYGTTHPSALYVTAMSSSRRGTQELAKDVRQIAGSALLSSAVGSIECAQIVHTYRQAGGKGAADVWLVGESYERQRFFMDEIARELVEGREDHDRKVAQWWADQIRSEHQILSDHGREAWEWWRRQGVPRLGQERGPGATVSHAVGSCKCGGFRFVDFDYLRQERARWDAHEASHQRGYCSESLVEEMAA